MAKSPEGEVVVIKNVVRPLNLVEIRSIAKTTSNSRGTLAMMRFLYSYAVHDLQSVDRIKKFAADLKRLAERLEKETK